MVTQRKELHFSAASITRLRNLRPEFGWRTSRLAFNFEFICRCGHAFTKRIATAHEIMCVNCHRRGLARFTQMGGTDLSDNRLTTKVRMMEIIGRFEVSSRIVNSFSWVATITDGTRQNVRYRFRLKADGSYSFGSTLEANELPADDGLHPTVYRDNIDYEDEVDGVDYGCESIVDPTDNYDPENDPQVQNLHAHWGN